ncbi:Uncharacterized conserved protein YecE, DUF72 family [Chitinophaga jiangningensis]|uniref:Uncharacterized conserved protein YecE, DUF72 family n=1 Tax=Chitinophaga jiangningensis TaxID=1419482 RepID=A0A1M7ATZ7_9BACT|nr:DUF72 domain-containing protein [Chitinophaga jiangningensis]SHL46248.1 Uncharacterized conserved protein YecE, DUF72 family [Chitinophaga jiangningensis]
MDFGANWAKYDQLNLELPADHPITGKVLKNGSGEGRIRFGSSGWTRKEYNGTLYPKGTSANNLLTEYSRLFDCVELNATHYKIYSAEEISKWMEKVKNKDFMFCPKFPQAISHHSSLLNAAEETNAFLAGIRAFGDQLGPAFLQLSESFSPARKLNLYKYLETLPEDIDFFVEVRHPDWFRQPYELNELLNTLRELSMGAVITDTPGRRDCLHMALTLPKLFLRFVTKGAHPLDMQRLLNWKDKLDDWTAQGLEEIYFFLHVHEGQHEAAFYREVQHVFGTAKGEVQLSLF